MKRLILYGLTVICTVLLFTGMCCAYEILIDVSPGILNLQSNGSVDTVHTNLDYDAVEVSSVFLNNVPLSFCKSDDLGYFVAKFDMDNIKGLPLAVGEYNTLLFVGVTDDGLAFSGSQDIKVINVMAKGR